MVATVVSLEERIGADRTTRRVEGDKAWLCGLIRSRAAPGVSMICGRFGFGDALMLTPTLRGLKELLPANPVHVYCTSSQFDILSQNPNVDLLVGVPRVLLTPSMFDFMTRSYPRAALMNGIINGNPEAEIANAYEMMARRVGVAPRSLVPEYHVLPEEMDRARQALLRHGLRPGEDRLVVLQPRASSILRCLPDETLVELIRALVQRGWKPIVFWQEAEIPRALASHALWTARDAAGLGLRDLCAMVALADLVIATDSMVSHLAPAFDIPSVLLYGPFDGALRAAHFPKAHVLQSVSSCGPCFQHGGRCVLEGRAIPSCMRWFRADAIVKAVEAAICGSRARPAARAPVARRSRPRRCKLCGHTVFLPYTRKGAVHYHRCIACGTAEAIVRRRKEAAGLFLLSGKRARRRLAMRGLLALMQTVNALVKRGGRRLLVLDCSTDRRIGALALRGMRARVEPCSHIRALPEGVADGAGSGATPAHGSADRDVVTMLHSLPFLRDLDAVLDRLLARLKEGGHLVLSTFLTDDIKVPSVSPVLVRRDPGDIPLIPSLKGLDALLGRRGLRRIWSSRIPGQPSSLCVFVKARAADARSSKACRAEDQRCRPR
jgi:ADP-heptose:LPS heptosyltransferase